MSVDIVTFGCRLNSYESELIKKSAQEAGLENTIIFNSCAVTSEAERQLRQAIRKAKRDNPSASIIVTGCAAQINPQKYSQMPEVDKVLGNEEKTKSDSYSNVALERVLVNDIMSIKETAHAMVDSFDGKSRAFIQVQNGCNHRCTFCIIPYGRGNSRSVGMGEVIRQAKDLVENGYKEIVLTGVDITDYGSNLPGTPKLGDLVEKLLISIPNLPRLRLSSIDVAEIDTKLFNIITSEERFMPHLHLSLQSGDNMILKRMKRRHSREDVIEFYNKVKALRPQIVFGADIIAGFPTETDEMFANTADLVTELGIAYLHVFPYSERDGTPAARMPSVPKEIRKRRAKILREIGLKNTIQHNKTQIGKKLNVISESGKWARAEDFSLVKLDCDVDAGQLLTVKITDIEQDYLVSNS